MELRLNHHVARFYLHEAYLVFSLDIYAIVCAHRIKKIILSDRLMSKRLRHIRKDHSHKQVTAVNLGST